MEGLSLKKIYALIREDLKSLSVYDFMRLWKILFEFLKEKRGIASFKGVATVDGEIVCSADLMCAKRRG